MMATLEFAPNCRFFARPDQIALTEEEIVAFGNGTASLDRAREMSLMMYSLLQVFAARVPEGRC